MQLSASTSTLALSLDTLQAYCPVLQRGFTSNTKANQRTFEVMCCVLFNLPVLNSILTISLMWNKKLNYFGRTHIYTILSTYITYTGLTNSPVCEAIKLSLTNLPTCPTGYVHVVLPTINFVLN